MRAEVESGPVGAPSAAGPVSFSGREESVEQLGREQEDDNGRGAVDHAFEYVRGNVHTNGLENYWSLLKRSIRGTYVSVEPFHLFRYLDEQAFRYNQRKRADETVKTDSERFVDVLKMIAGKRLTYEHLTGND